MIAQCPKISFGRIRHLNWHQTKGSSRCQSFFCEQRFIYCPWWQSPLGTMKIFHLCQKRKVLLYPEFDVAWHGYHDISWHPAGWNLCQLRHPHIDSFGIGRPGGPPRRKGWKFEYTKFRHVFCAFFWMFFWILEISKPNLLQLILNCSFLVILSKNSPGIPFMKIQENRCANSLVVKKIGFGEKANEETHLHCRWTFFPKDPNPSLE